QDRAVGRPKEIAVVQVAVDTLGPRGGERRRDGVGDVERDLPIARREALGDEAALQQDLDRFADVGRRVEPQAVRRVARGAHRVHATDGPSDPASVLRIELIERAPADLRERGVVDPLDLAERRARAEVERRDRRYLGRREVREEPVLVEDRLARPAARPVELHDEAPLVLQLHLVHAVLEGPQRQAAAGRRAEAVRADVAHEDQVRAMIARVLARFGRLDVLVNNAGVMTRGPFLDVPVPDYGGMFAVNVTGTLLCTQHALRPMLAARY